MNLAAQYRPNNFNDVIGQDSTITILQNQLKTGDTKNAYLFVGPAGCGKTTTARILATELNGNNKGIIEIDGASNNGVENIRNLIDDARFKPIDTTYKIYVIDECHALSNSAWQSMLKILEEPPAYVVFILCTTDPQKIPATILSRCQRFDYKKVSVELITSRLKYIIECENKQKILDNCGSQDAINDIEWAIKEGIEIIQCDDEALDYIAKLAEGGVRKAISLLDTCLSYKPALTIDDIREILGTADYNIMLSLLLAIDKKNELQIVEIIESLYSNGKDLKLFIQQFMEYLVDIQKFYLLNDITLVSIPTIYLSYFVDNKLDVMTMYKNVHNLYQQVKYETNIKYMVEGGLMVLCK